MIKRPFLSSLPSLPSLSSLQLVLLLLFSASALLPPLVASSPTPPFVPPSSTSNTATSSFTSALRPNARRAHPPPRPNVKADAHAVHNSDAADAAGAASVTRADTVHVQAKSKKRRPSGESPHIQSKCVDASKVKKELKSVEKNMKRYDRRYHDYPNLVRRCALKGSRSDFTKYFYSHACIQTRKVVEVVHENIMICEGERFRRIAGARMSSKSAPTSSAAKSTTSTLTSPVLWSGAKYFYEDAHEHEMHDCGSGHHWCCIFFGDDPGYPCWEWHCRGVSGPYCTI